MLIYPLHALVSTIQGNAIEDWSTALSLETTGLLNNSIESAVPHSHQGSRTLMI